MLEAEKRGLVEESAIIYADNYKGAIVDDGEGHLLKDIFTASGQEAIVDALMFKKSVKN